MRLLLGGHHVDVVGDEELPDAGDGGAPRGDELGRAEVGRPFGLLELLGHALVLAGANLAGDRHDIVI